MLPDAAVRWVCDVTGTSLADAVELPGATSSSVTLLTFADGRELVLRLHTDDEWLAREPDLATREAVALRALSGMSVAAPELVAVDEHGGFCGRPAVLMSRLPGRADLSDASPLRLHALAHALRPLHARAVPEGLPGYAPYLAAGQRVVPPWANDVSSWRRAIEICDLSAPAGPACFIHRDYHPGNVLIAGGTVSGIIDWVNACIGPPEIDVAHCRVNLAIVHGLAAADTFAEAASAGAPSDRRRQAYWDLVDCLDLFEEDARRATAPGPGAATWNGVDLLALTGIGAPPASPALVRQRLSAYVTDAVRRWEEAG